MAYKILESFTPDQCFIHIKSWFKDYSYSICSNCDISDYQVFHLKNGEDTLGSVVFRYFWKSIELKYLLVYPNARKTGIGSNLISFVHKIAQDKKCNFINLETMYEDTLKFYEKFGYQIEFIRNNYSYNKKRFYLIKYL